MFNLFPELAYFAPFVLRVALGVILFLTSFHQLTNMPQKTRDRFVSEWPKYGVFSFWITGIVETMIGLAFIAGFYTQVTALATILLSLIAIFSKKHQRAVRRSATFYALALAISLSLILTGAGPFGFDVSL